MQRLAGAFRPRVDRRHAPVAGGASTASTFGSIAASALFAADGGEPSPLRNPHQYVSMRIAAEAGLRQKSLSRRGRPHVVIDFIAQQPLHGYPGGSGGIGAGVGAFWRASRPRRCFRISQLSRYRHAAVRACAPDRAFRAGCSIACGAA